MYDLSGKRILVTGSTRGIGKAIAKKLIESGAIVGINGRDVEQTKAVAEELKGATEIVPLAYDLSNPENATQIVKDFIDATGGIDGLVNNAGHGKSMAFRGVTLDKWQSTFALNVESALMTCQAAYNQMRRQKGGTIVNMASISAHGPGKWMSADYAASKAALVSLTKSLAFESARLGIRVNAVSPGMVDTDMTKIIPQANRDGMNIPLKRFAQPEEIANVVAFLLSDDSQYITGQSLNVDGGLHFKD
ncbi:MAG: SDR family NAD(P)-dependent oxidoreductase [Kiritimatiellae bacterium]|jgi:3-oxoacyl-[acyl-carrier protein] reductase|nr:SDR family NAD(P)-dependent oxidoreductase [Kiritimatiellia bacterium]